MGAHLHEVNMPIFIPPHRARAIADLAIEIERARNAIASLTTEVERLDGHLQYLSRDRQRGVARDALAILRRAGEPMGLRALTVAVMTERDQETADAALVLRNMEKLRVSMTRYRQQGVVWRELGCGRMPAMWEVA
jgi:hypothetical protein